MNTIILIPLMFIFGLQLSCMPEKQMLDTDNINQFSTTNQNYKTDSKDLKKLSQIELNGYETVVYTVLLRSLYYNGGEHKNFGVELDGMAGLDVFCYRKETISPKTFSELDSLSEVSKEIAENFKQVNQKSENLLGGFDVKAPLRNISGDRDLEKLFPKAEKLSPKLTKNGFKTKALIGLSNIGFNKIGTQALIYVEYYSRTKGLKKMYILVPIRRDGDSIDISPNEMIAIPVK